MASGGGEGNIEKPPPFRWLDVARYAVASVVTVLILAVIINSIKVVLRPGTLSLSVTGGSLPVTRSPTPEKVVVFYSNLRAQNPSGRARIYYINITAYLFDSNTSASSSNPAYDSMFYFHLEDIVVLHQEDTVYSSLRANGTKDYMPEYFDTLYNNKNATISDVTMRLDGNLTTEVTINKTRLATFYCTPLIVGGDPDDEAFKKPDDVLCVKG
ncbi:uncharacterized protein LOC133925794 [Phragmites australis]|uniref:uncharacterized protein LOC133925794 n=1 Tax=Phragmites australis TaxID=29695 RepID=UPI002D787F89|nr:uncharacterized protein LOC133925794 [Phragmites australis]